MVDESRDGSQPGSLGGPVSGQVVGVPPPPSVTPGSAPPPPPGASGPTPDRQGCLPLVLLGAAASFVVVLLLAVLVLAGVTFFGTDDGSSDAEVLQDVFIQTGIASASTDAEHPPQRDIRLGVCEGDGRGGVRAAGTLTNWTSSPADYRIDVSFRSTAPESAGTVFASRVVEVDDVAGVATVEWSASVDEAPEGAFACRIVAVDRWKAGQRPGA